MKLLPALALLPFVSARIVLIDDIPGEETHGGVSIDSTSSGIDHIIRKMNYQKTNKLGNIYPRAPLNEAYYPKRPYRYDSPQYSRIQAPSNPAPPYPGYLPPPFRGGYPASPYVTPPQYYEYPAAPNTALSYLQAKIASLLQQIHEAKKDQDAHETQTNNLDSKKKAFLSNLKETIAEQEAVEATTAATKRDLANIQTELETLRGRLGSLAEKTETLEKKQQQIEASIQETEFAISGKAAEAAQKQANIHQLQQNYTELHSQYLREIGQGSMPNNQSNT
ncbi:hypothetical protein NEDG_01054 [Nematocida displodere]|uniref:Uncharacterized protein n=1 Tax=Nematocida displodere TaxID=1805483 RepID=A0A177EAH4_9MICR|nr:hypothetical protein NEDG_01054 [Nematocida displodere]